MDKIFKALSDSSRRQLLDLLKEKDGQSLSQLESKFPDMTRFGIMKHLKILEEAHLISSQKTGRFKYHYLNTVPIQELADRWISRFAAPWSTGIVDLKSALEATQEKKQLAKHKEEKPMQNKPSQIYKTIIQTSQNKLWEALINPDITQHYFFGLRVNTDWQTGSDISYSNESEEAIIQGKILLCEPKQKISYTFKGHKNDTGNMDADSRVTFEIEELSSNACQLTVVHDEFPSENTTYQNVGNGWPTILSGLKTYLETGKPLITK